MKNTQVSRPDTIKPEHFKARITEIEALLSEIASLKELLPKHNARLAALENAVDFTDPGAMADVVSAQAVAALIPRRIVMKSNRLANADAELGALIEPFKEKTSRPFVATLRDAITAKIKRELPPSLQGEHASANAIAHASETMFVSQVQSEIEGQHFYEGKAHMAAGRLLVSFDKLTKFAADLDAGKSVAAAD